MCLSHSSGEWEVQDQGAGKFDVWLESTAWFTDGHLLTAFSHSGRSEKVLWGLFNKDINLIQPHDLITS